MATSVISLPALILIFTTPSPLIIGLVGGIIGTLCAVPLVISYYIGFAILHVDNQSTDEFSFLFLPSILLFIESILAGVWIAISDYSPISKLASSPSFLMAFEVSDDVGLYTAALTVVSAIVIVSAIAIFKNAKEHILQKEPSEKGVHTQQKESAKPSSSQQEVDIAGLDKSENLVPSN